MVVVGSSVAGLWYQAEQVRRKAEGLVRQLLNADIGQVAKTIEDMSAYRHWADPLLVDALQ